MININFGDLFKSLGSFLAKNWQSVGLVIMVVLFFVTKNDYSSLKKAMDVMTESYQQQIEALEELHKKELEARKRAQEEYEKQLEEVTEKYEQALSDLKRSKEDDIKGFVRDFEVQPMVLAEEIEKQFGFKYVE